MGLDKLVSEFFGALNVNAGGIILFIIFLLSIIQISPIKVNPWSWIAKKISSGIIGTMAESMEKIENDINIVSTEVENIKADATKFNDEIAILKDKIEEQVAIASRVRILRMNDEILRGTKHTKEHFDQSLIDITIYDEYCKEHPKFKNNMTTLSSENIKGVYKECLKKHSFLGYTRNYDDAEKHDEDSY